MKNQIFLEKNGKNMGEFDYLMDIKCWGVCPYEEKYDILGKSS